MYNFFARNLQGASVAAAAYGAFTLFKEDILGLKQDWLPGLTGISLAMLSGFLYNQYDQIGPNTRDTYLNLAAAILTNTAKCVLEKSGLRPNVATIASSMLIAFTLNTFGNYLKQLNRNNGEAVPVPRPNFR